MMIGGFDANAEAFLDFARCQRPDGSYYGTAGQCRKGKEVSAEDLEKLKKAASKGNKKAKLAVEVVEGKKTKAEAAKELKSISKESPTEQKPVERKEGSYTPKDSKEETGVKADLVKDAFGNENFRFSPKRSAERLENLEQRKMPAKQKKALKKDFEVEEKQSQNNKKFIEDLEKNLPKTAKLEVTPEGIFISSKTASGDTVVSSYNLVTGFGFKVNDSFNAGSVTDRVAQVRVANTVRSQYDALVKSLPTGHIMKTSAWTQDGKGEMRQRAYEKMGFSKDVPGNTITAVKQADGSMAPGRPGNRGLGDQMDQQKDPNSLWFSEEEKERTKLWLQIVFGVNEG
jgi:hypothetical protein